MARTPGQLRGGEGEEAWKADWKEHSTKQGSEDPGLVPAPPFTSCGTLGKLLNLPASRFLLPL